MGRTRIGAAAVVAAAVVAAGCGGSETAAGDRKVEPIRAETAGSVAQYADCDDWRAGTREQRMAAIADIRGQHTPQNSTTAASPLSDERAYEILDRACAAPNPGSLRLYKLYVRAQGFSPLND